MSGRRIAIVGGGVSGLAAARQAQRAGDHIVLFESSDRLGGAVRTERHGSWLIERGPHTLQGTPAVGALLGELALGPLIAGRGAPLKRYVARGGRCVALPDSPSALLKGKYFGWGTKRRVLREKFAPLPAPREDLPFADLVEHRFGAEALTWAAQPFVSGIYAGDPARLSSRYAFPRLWTKLQRAGSLLRAEPGASRMAAPPALLSFDGGLGRLIAALASPLPARNVRLQTGVSDLARRPDGGWEVCGEAFDRVLVALPAPAAARLRVNGRRHGAAAALAGIPHPPLTVLNLGYRRSSVAHPLDGFGCLVPAAEGRSVLGVIFVSSLFPDRGPPDHVSLTVMLGGTLQPGMARSEAGEALACARGDLRDLLGIADDPVFAACTHYPTSIPQITLAHPDTLAALAAVEAEYPGLEFRGSYRHGISLPDCLTPSGSA